MGASIAQMTVVLGGFSSSYYQGMNLIFFSASVLTPVRWRWHAATQAPILAYYYAANLTAARPDADATIAVENTFFLLWTCTLACSSVFLYERLLRGQFHARNTGIGLLLDTKSPGPIFLLPDGFTATSIDGGIANNSFATAQPSVPLPASLMLLGCGFVVFLSRRRHRA
jgi:hypothetical protein